MKSEPSELSVDHLAALPKRTVGWFGVRNYQARNFMRDQMCLGDQAFFYHSSCDEPGIVGVVEICKLAYPDQTQFNPKSKYYDRLVTPAKPRWFNVNVKLLRKTRLISIQELRTYPKLSNMRILQKGNRLSITPVDPTEWRFIVNKF